MYRIQHIEDNISFIRQSFSSEKRIYRVERFKFIGKDNTHTKKNIRRNTQNWCIKTIV